MEMCFKQQQSYSTNRQIKATVQTDRSKQQYQHTEQSIVPTDRSKKQYQQTEQSTVPTDRTINSTNSNHK